MPGRGGAGESRARGDVLAGMRAVSPALLGVAPFGITFGVVAVASGVSPWEAMCMSALVFAGASQLAAVDMLTGGSPLWLVAAAGLMINLRYCMYSAGLARHFNGASLLARASAAFWMTDQAFAVATLRFGVDRRVSRTWFYLGAAWAMYLVWLTGTAAGVFLGAVIPSTVSLDFAAPITFLALIAPTITDKPTRLAAMVGTAASLLGHGLPKGVGLMLGAGCGIAAGMWLESRQMRNGGDGQA